MGRDHDAYHLAASHHGLECAAMASCAPTSRPSARRFVVAAGRAGVLARGGHRGRLERGLQVGGLGRNHAPVLGPAAARREVRAHVRRGERRWQLLLAFAEQDSPSTKGNVRLASASPEQVARRNAVISELQNRECVVALEAIDRMARSGQPVDPTDFRRRQQTADLNCSRDPVTRRQQEEQAARLRVSKGDACVDARNKLADMLAPGRRPTREQLKTQQEFIESHCRVPVR